MNGSNHRQNTSRPLIPALMSDRIFQRFSAFIYDEVGIKMPDAKKTMLEARLQKRLKALGASSFEEYSDYVFSPEGRNLELIHFIDVVTTNKTDFFREPAHFEYLVKSAIPALFNNREEGLSAPLRVWSAGCSTGEEPYTLAMVLSDFAASNQGFRYHILASDISSQVLEKARTAVYPEERVNTIPLQIKKRYLLKSKEKNRALVRIVPELRAMIQFIRLNFMDSDFGIKELMEIIFCRNVIIYFDKATQKKLITKFYKQLVPGGYLFLGHSETLSGLDIPLKPVSSTVYRKV